MPIICNELTRLSVSWLTLFNPGDIQHACEAIVIHIHGITRNVKTKQICKTPLFT